MSIPRHRASSNMPTTSSVIISTPSSGSSLIIAGAASHNNISLATIYNTLHSFVDKKILKLVSIKEGKAIFCTNMKEHYHFFNPKTGELIDIPNEKIKIKKLPKPPKGTKIDNIEITINLAKN